MVFKTIKDHSIFHANDLNADIIEQLEDGSFKIKDNYLSKMLKEFECEYCHKKFIDQKSSHRGKHIYCSQECCGKSRIKTDIPKEQLEELVKEYSLVQIGKMFGLSDNTIKKKCVRYNINYKQYSHDIQSKINKQNLSNYRNKLKQNN